MNYFCLINGAPFCVPVSQMKFHVDAKEKFGLVGTWHNGKLYSPDMEQFRATLPYRWRAAFDRETAKGSLGFWYDNDNSDRCHISISDRRGKYLATVYCFFRESE